MLSSFPPIHSANGCQIHLFVVGFDVDESLQWSSHGVQCRHTSVDVDLVTTVLIIIVLCKLI